MSDAKARARLEQLQVENPRLRGELDAPRPPSEARRAAEAGLEPVSRERTALESELYALHQRETAARDQQDRRRMMGAGFAVPWWSSWTTWVVLLAMFIWTFMQLMKLDPEHVPVPGTLGAILLALPAVVNVTRVLRARTRRTRAAQAAVRAQAQLAPRTDPVNEVAPHSHETQPRRARQR